MIRTSSMATVSHIQLKQIHGAIKFGKVINIFSILNV